MFAKQKGLWWLAVISIVATVQNEAQGSSDLVNSLPELKKDVHAVCPRPWESIYSRIIYINGDKVTEPAGELYQFGNDIWHGQATDKSRYITYAYKQLITRENELTLDYASSDGAVISACGFARAALIDTVLRARSEETAAFFEQHVRDLVRDDDSDTVFNLQDACPDDYSRLCISGNENRDNCPDTPLGEVADKSGEFRGCSLSQKDTDNDGLNDAIDQCESTPLGEVADIDGPFVGCSLTQKDTDGDGLNDAFDACPGSNIPEFDVNVDGCALNEVDTDGDGINDFDDPYPHQDEFLCYP